MEGGGHRTCWEGHNRPDVCDWGCFLSQLPLPTGQVDLGCLQRNSVSSPFPNPPLGLFELFHPEFHPALHAISDPMRLKGIFCRNSRLCIGIQAFVQQEPKIRSEGGAFLFRGLFQLVGRGLVENIVAALHLVAFFDEGFSHRQFIEDRSQRPDVRFAVGRGDVARGAQHSFHVLGKRGMENHLWRGVEELPHEMPFLSVFQETQVVIGQHVPGKLFVLSFHPVVGQEDVVRTDVSVDDAPCVEVRQGRKNINGESKKVGFLQNGMGPVGDGVTEGMDRYLVPDEGGGRRGRWWNFPFSFSHLSFCLCPRSVRNSGRTRRRRRRYRS
mmetsp:Transcript_26146/g.66373  ORF Transcript_26146/g.66373 Transcript_26146/m.66373 type:complete len:327 (+) Transcript_26146:319-1299(+)